MNERGPSGGDPRVRNGAWSIGALRRPGRLRVRRNRFGSPEPAGFDDAGNAPAAGFGRREPRFSGIAEGRAQVTFRVRLLSPARSAAHRSTGVSLLRERRGRETGFGRGWGPPLRKRKPRRAAARGDSGRPGTDPCREQHLEAAGHRDLLVLRAAGCDVGNGRKAQGTERRPALQGGKALKGEPQEWHPPWWREGRRGSKPSGG